MQFAQIYFAPTPAPFSRHTVAAPLKDEEAQIQALEDKIDALRSREAAQEAALRQDVRAVTDG